MWPEAGICTERNLYANFDGQIAMSMSAREYVFTPPARIIFDGWFNLFNLEKWNREAELKTLFLTLEGEGQFELRINLAPKSRSWDRVVNEVITLTPGEPLSVDVSHALGAPFVGGLVFFELRTLGEEQSRLRMADWQTADAPQRVPELTIAVTTFKREDEVARTVARFAEYRTTSAIGDHLNMIVTDNGQSVEMDPPDGVRLVPNANLGGAGGFTRGMLEAKAAGASHCLFMDDDASIHMDSLERTWAFLAYAKDPNTAISGAMISEQHRWAIWENGARFNSFCRPMFGGTDLRDPNQARDMEHEATAPVPDDFYGGWWYFAFPIAEAKHLAYPFFVRGDDVSFSLANDFNILTLNGVVSFQESFTEKQSPQTWYLDLRSHMLHHLCLEKMEIGAKGVLKIPLAFFLRNMPRMHYNTLSAINLAFEDVMQGPDFFEKNADMAQRRSDIKALTTDEVWEDMRGANLPPVREEPPRRRTRTIMKVLGNGLLLPGFSRFGKRITVLAEHRDHIGYCWGASEMNIMNAEQTKFYRVQHSKGAALREGLRFMRNAVTFLKRYEDLKASYQNKYAGMTSEDFWNKKFGK